MSKNSGDNTNPINQRYETALNDYNNLRDQYAGNAGYQNAINQSQGQAQKINELSTQAGYSGANQQTAASTNSAIDKGAQMQAAQNAQAQRYAGQQAGAAAAGTQSQATTAARSAGMNKAQAAMMGSQQNANAYQNAYGNAYSQQLGNAQSNQNTQLANYNSAFENNANRMNANLNQQQGMAQQSGQAALNAQGNVLGAQQQEGQNIYNREYGNRGFWTGLFTSDERLKNYRECTKKVVMRTPSKLKVTIKGDK